MIYGSKRLAPDFSAELLVKCTRILKASAGGAIIRAETLSALFDSLVHAGRQGHQDYIPAVLRQLPGGVVDGLLDYASKHPQPRVFVPFRSARDEAASLEVQRRLVDQLKDVRGET